MGVWSQGWSLGVLDIFEDWYCTGEERARRKYVEMIGGWGLRRERLSRKGRAWGECMWGYQGIKVSRKDIMNEADQIRKWC